MKGIIDIVNIISFVIVILLLMYPVYYLIGHTETTMTAILHSKWYIPMLGCVIALGVVILNRKYR